MKTIFTFLPVLALGLLPLSADDAVALVALADENPQRVWITAASEKNIEFKVTEISVDLKRLSRDKIETIYFFEPKMFTEAMILFRERDYEAAQEQFKLSKEAFKKTENLPGNYSSLSGFYEMECARKRGDYEALEVLKDNFLPEKLLREDHRNQVELCVLWEAVQSKSWRRLDALADELLKEEGKWTNSQLTQIYFAKGLALEGLKQIKPALIALNFAFTADFTSSEEITKQAAIACFRLYEADESVKLARKLFGTPDERPGSDGHQLLLEAASLARMWEKALGSGEPLPKEFQGLLEFKPSAKPVAAPPKKEEAAEEKKEDAKEKEAPKKKEKPAEKKKPTKKKEK